MITCVTVPQGHGCLRQFNKSCSADETDTLYAVVEKKTTTEAKPSATKPESEQKNESKRERQEGATAAEATGASGTSRNVVRLID